MNIKSDFIKPENVYLIWELLSEQNIIKNQPNQVKEQISNYVVNEIHNFYNNISNNQISKNSLTLMYLNKEYIKYIILYVKTNYPNQINKIKIHEEPVTFKDIQDQRELEFNTKFNEMQNDFKNMVTLKKPETPQFEDNMGVGDKPVSVNDMEERIKEMTMKRNYDLQTFETNNENETNNEKKSVSFENEKKEESVTDDFHEFFNNLYTYEESNNINDNNTDNITINDNITMDNITMDIINTDNDTNTNINIDTDTDTDTTNSILNLQKQVHYMQNKIDSLETKLDLILNKI